MITTSLCCLVVFINIVTPPPTANPAPLLSPPRLFPRIQTNASWMFICTSVCRLYVAVLLSLKSFVFRFVFLLIIVAVTVFKTKKYIQYIFFFFRGNLPGCQAEVLHSPSLAHTQDFLKTGSGSDKGKRGSREDTLQHTSRFRKTCLLAGRSVGCQRHGNESVEGDGASHVSVATSPPPLPPPPPPHTPILSSSRVEN